MNFYLLLVIALIMILSRSINIKLVVSLTSFLRIIILSGSILFGLKIGAILIAAVLTICNLFIILIYRNVYSWPVCSLYQKYNILLLFITIVFNIRIVSHNCMLLLWFMRLIKNINKIIFYYISMLFVTLLIFKVFTYFF